MITFYTYAQSPIGRLMLTGNEHALTGLYFSSGNKARTTLMTHGGAMTLILIKHEENWMSTLSVGGDTDVASLRERRHSKAECWMLCGSYLTEKCDRINRLLRLLVHLRRCAVGNANGNNPLAIFIPCHRVVGSNGALTGFGGGLEAAVSARA